MLRNWGKPPATSPDGHSLSLLDSAALRAEVSRHWTKTAAAVFAVALFGVALEVFSMNQLVAAESWLSQHYVGVLLLAALSLGAKLCQALACTELLPQAFCPQVDTLRANRAFRFARIGLRLDRSISPLVWTMLVVGFYALAAKEHLNLVLDTYETTAAHAVALALAVVLRLSPTRLVRPTVAHDQDTAEGRAVAALLRENILSACGIRWFSDVMTDFEVTQTLHHVVAERLKQTTTNQPAA